MKKSDLFSALEAMEINPNHNFLPPLKIRGGGSVFKFEGVMKKLLRNRGLVERGVLLERGSFQIVSSVFLQKSMFSLLLDFFVW